MPSRRSEISDKDQMGIELLELSQRMLQTNISLADVQQKIDQMLSSSQLQNKPFQGMDSYYVLSDSIQENNSICNTVLELFEQKLDTTPPIKVINSVETPSLNDLKNPDNTKNMSYDVDVPLVAIKAYFMNEIYELKREISQLKFQKPGSVTV